jgi:hypothetical protein
MTTTAAIRREAPTWVLVALVLGVAVILSVACFVPLLFCPNCENVRWGEVPVIVRGAYVCYRCEDRHRITLLNRWLKGAPEFRSVPMRER